MISQSAEYALRAVVCLADGNGRPRTVQQLASATKAPAGYLSKVLQAMGRAGLVRSQRGLHGGFTLTRSPDRLTILEVVNAVDAIQRIRTCPLGLASHGADLCPLHRRLDEAMALAEQAFRECTVAELLATPSRSKPLCSGVEYGEDTPTDEDREGRTGRCACDTTTRPISDPTAGSPHEDR